MKKKCLLFILFFPILLLAQLEQRISFDATPAHKWELGVHMGHLFVAGDIPFKPGFAGGFHIRRALDYVFSFRLDANYGVMNGERFNGTNQFTTNWFSTTLQGLISVNNLKWDEPARRTNLYVFVGGGINNFSVEQYPNGGNKGINVNKAISPILDIGGGISIRLNEKMNIGMDHKFGSLFSKYADRMDGFENKGFRDIANYTTIRLNINVGKKDKSEPLYWVNPLQNIISDITALKERPNFVPTDSDGDGVLDLFDLESNTPPGTPVDTRGVTLDSDGDGIPDNQDKEPYSPPNYKYNEEGVATQPTYITEEEVDRRIKEQLEMIPLFFPNIHFKTSQFDIRETELPKLKHIADLLKLNDNLKLAVIGYTDQKGSEHFNDLLSYQRAEAVIQHLIVAHGMSKERFILLWKGDKDAIVVDQEESYMNRRVEFKIATADMEDMDKPKKKTNSKF
ncbi:MAG: OmpA family protein [Saprospiraceae bacterium]|nr:OmpA family protein [Saprospiraceae bacterium]